MHADWEEQVSYKVWLHICNVYTNYVQVHKCKKNFHTYKKLQAEITEKFKNSKVKIKKILRSK